MISISKRLLAFSVPVCMAMTSNAQNQDTLYYDFAGKKTVYKNTATQFAVGKQQGNLLVVSKYMINGTLLLTGSYSADGKKEGFFKHYERGIL